jgi:hypothetical protein
MADSGPHIGTGAATRTAGLTGQSSTNQPSRPFTPSFFQSMQIESLGADSDESSVE